MMIQSVFRATTWLALLLVVTFTQAQLQVDSSSQCACAFTQARESDCYVYNSAGAFPIASEACKEGVGANDNRYIPYPLDFWRLCPFPTQTDVNTEEMVTLVRRYSDSDAAQYGEWVQYII